MDEQGRGVAEIVSGKLASDAVPDRIASLVLDAIGGAPASADAPDAGGEAPGRAYLKSVSVQGFRGIGPLWPRACALMIRLALEVTLDRYWARALPAAASVGMRQQLLLLPRYAGDPAAALAREAWLGLAGAAHHHAYELAPTAAELRRWHTTVRRLGDLLALQG